LIEYIGLIGMSSSPIIQAVSIATVQTTPPDAENLEQQLFKVLVDAYRAAVNNLPTKRELFVQQGQLLLQQGDKQWKAGEIQQALETFKHALD
jgi:hypothetical protein